MKALRTPLLITVAILAVNRLAPLTLAQQAPPRDRASQQPLVLSPEVSSDRHITFRLYAPNADKVKLGPGDIPSKGLHTEMTKATNGVWELTIGPIDPGPYRYNFNLDGVTVVDPRNSSISESVSAC